MNWYACQIWKTSIAVLIEDGLNQKERLIKLNKIATVQDCLLPYCSLSAKSNLHKCIRQCCYGDIVYCINDMLFPYWYLLRYWKIKKYKVGTWISLLYLWRFYLVSAYRLETRLSRNIGKKGQRHQSSKTNGGLTQKSFIALFNIACYNSFSQIRTNGDSLVTRCFLTYYKFPVIQLSDTLISFSF